MEMWFASNFARTEVQGSRDAMRILAPETLETVPPGAKLYALLDAEDTFWLSVEAEEAITEGLFAAERGDGACFIGIMPGADSETVRQALQHLHASRLEWPAPVRLRTERMGGQDGERIQYMA